LSLNGNLEDLPLLDILQIVSFSRKTGYLTIRTPSGEGAIIFRDGFVVSSFAWDSPPLDPRAASLPHPQHQELVKRRIEMALEQLIRLREGQFSFSLADAPPTMVGPRDIANEMLTDGINAQELLLDLARGMDEDRRDSTAALEASFAEAQAPVDDETSFSSVLVPAPEAPVPAEAELLESMGTAPPAPVAGDGDLESLVADTPAPEAPLTVPASPAEEPSVPVEAVPAASPSAAPASVVAAAAATDGGSLRTVLLVDDEPEVRQVLAQHMAEAGFEVAEAEDPESAVKAALRLGKERKPFVLVTDLGMPTSGGTSFQGGFEVVKRLVKMNHRPPVLLMTESLSSTVQSRSRQLGIANFVFKPGLSKLDPEQFEADLEAFARKIVADILPRLARRPRAAAPAPAAASPTAAPAPPPPAAPLPPDDLSRHFTILQQRLDELRKPQDASQISMLVMKTAREFFERGILLLVKNEELRGLGGFGRGPGDENLNLLARDITIPLLERSAFSEAVAGRRPFSGPLADGPWTEYFFGKIGRFHSTSVALLPLLTNRETVAVLFGDNPETGRDLGRLDALAVFMNQAGIALENAFLQRKVHALQGQE
jgi:CheY-like chemotaxis protein